MLPEGPSYQDLSTQLSGLLDRTRATAYHEEASGCHQHFTVKAWDRIKTLVALAPSDYVLDIGCGEGGAIALFSTLAHVLGITCLESEAEKVSAHNPGSVWVTDMHNISVFDGVFKLVWARHVLEHSPVVNLMLHMIHRALVPGGYSYIEVPAYGTSCQHELNPNHYTVLPSRSWMALLQHHPFQIISAWEEHVETPMGDDWYFGFLLRRPV